MKPFSILTLSAALVFTAAAEEAPAGKNQPPAGQANNEKAAEPAGPAFLGVGTTVIPPILVDQLQLEAGVGVMISSLQDDSPATQAGLKAGDIITRIAGKPVKSTLDLGEKIRAHQPGDKVRIEVIQKGKTANLEIALVERPKDIPDWAPDEAIQNLDDRVNGMQQQLQQFQLQLGGAMPGLQGGLNIQGGINIQGGGELRMNDGEGMIGFSSGDDGTEITVRDLQDKVIWSGPWDTEQDKAAAPDDIRRRIERLNIRQNRFGNGIQLRMDGNGIEIPDIQEDPENPPADEEEP